MTHPDAAIAALIEKTTRLAREELFNRTAAALQDVDGSTSPTASSRRAPEAIVLELLDLLAGSGTLHVPARTGPVLIRRDPAAVDAAPK
jgi:hypothetical protein